nr:hypothetical protein [Lachnospiraceae bacterium]
YKTEITITSGSAEKVYDGTPLTDPTVEVSGLPEGFSCECRTFGSLTDAGTEENGITYQILNGSIDVTDKFTNIKLVKGTLTVTPAQLEVTTGSDEKEYDNTPLYKESASISGLVSGENAEVTATGTITDAGSTVNTYKIDWDTASPNNYTIVENLGTLTITPIKVTFALCCPEEPWDYCGEDFIPEWIDGKYSDDSEVEYGEFNYILDANENPIGSRFEFTMQYGEKLVLSVGAYKNAGTYTITPTANFETGNSANYDMEFVDNVLVIRQAKLTVTTGSSEKEYDGTALTNPESDIQCETEIGLEGITITTTGSQTEVGTSSNTYEIDWGSNNSQNYDIEEHLGTLTVTPVETVVWENYNSPCILEPDNEDPTEDEQDSEDEPGSEDDDSPGDEVPDDPAPEDTGGDNIPSESE